MELRLSMYKGRKPVSFWKGDNMRHDDTRDNTTAIESNLIAADAYTDTREDAPAKILPVIVTVDELPRLACDYPKPYNPQHVVGGVVVEERHPEHNDGANGYDDDDDIEEDDGQPSEYDEWQDYMGGDDWDHGQYDDCGW